MTTDPTTLLDNFGVNVTTYPVSWNTLVQDLDFLSLPSPRRLGITSEHFKTKDRTRDDQTPELMVPFL